MEAALAVLRIHADEHRPHAGPPLRPMRDAVADLESRVVELRARMRELAPDLRPTP